MPAMAFLVNFTQNQSHRTPQELRDGSGRGLIPALLAFFCDGGIVCGMSVPNMPVDNGENSGETDGGKHQIKYNWRHYFRFRPVPFAQFLLPQIAGPESGGQQRGYSAKLLAGVRRIVANDILASIALLIVAAAFGYCLYAIGLFSAAGITACAAIAAVYWARMQWRIYSKQCDVMRDQHSAMVKQIGLAEGQLEQMRFEQRAWLAIHDVEIKPLGDGARVQCVLKIKNTGKTPGKITAMAVGFYIQDQNYYKPELIEQFEAQGFTRKEEFVFPPEGMIPLRMYCDNFRPNTEMIEEIRVGRKELVVICKFAYVDTRGGTHGIKGFFTLKPPGPDVHHEANYCCMD